MLTTRLWGDATVLLCILLLQNCQSDSARATEEEEPVVSPHSASAMRQCVPSKPLAMISLTPPSASLAARVSSSRFSTNSAHKEALSAAPLAHSLSPPARPVLATASNFLKASYNLPAVAKPRASHAVPLGNPPRHAFSVDSPRVCARKVERALREIPSDEEENSKPPAKREFSDLDDGIARNGERWEHKDIRQSVLDVLLAMAESEPDKATEFLDVLLVAAQDNNCRQQALQALGTVAQASPDMSSSCLSSLRAAAEGEDENIRLLALKTLGEVEWKHYLGEVGPAPDLPINMAAILDSTCPFWPDKKVRDTHLLVLIPAKVNGQPFSLNLLRELIQNPNNGGHKTKYRYYSSRVRMQFGASSPTASYWLLMTRNVLPESRNKTYANQKKIVADHEKRTSLPYELPKALEAATAILTHYVRNGERLYSDSPWWIFTCCHELVDGEHPAVVGGFEYSGLGVDDSRYGNEDFFGVAGCRKFF
jgi:hypothetical protein